MSDPPPTRTRHPEGGDDAPVEDLIVEVIEGPDAGRSLALTPGTWLVGKREDCALKLSDPEVSRLHLELRTERMGVVVRDLGSKNGTLYRGARLTLALVGSGAVLTLGGTRLRFVQRSSQASADSPTANAPESFGRLFGRSPSMRRLFAALERIAPTGSAILIEGETGTGKELCAEAIHARSGRAGGPFVICDFGAVSRALIESDLFGHKKGAFTGASEDRRGAFESASGGTLFLDEIGELDLELQSRLLRGLESGQVRRVGELRYRTVDVRVIAATHRNLEEEVRAGSFRKDLFHRLAVIRLRIPPLRERREDVAPLVETMLAERGARASSAALALLEEHDWPGNVRELGNLVERGLALTPPGSPLEPNALGLADGAVGSAAADDYHHRKERLIESWERRYLDEILRASGGVTEASRKSGLGRAHIYRLMRKYGIER